MALLPKAFFCFKTFTTTAGLKPYCATASSSLYTLSPSVARSGSSSKLFIEVSSLLKKTSSYYDPSKKEIFYDNFIDGTLVNGAYFIGYDKKKLDYIRDKLHELSPSQFSKAFDTEQSLRYIKERIDSPISKHDNITPEMLSEDLTPVLDSLFENIDQIVETYK